jgi:hypothetical protein
MLDFMKTSLLSGEALEPGMIGSEDDWLKEPLRARWAALIAQDCPLTENDADLDWVLGIPTKNILLAYTQN